MTKQKVLNKGRGRKATKAVPPSFVDKIKFVLDPVAKLIEMNSIQDMARSYMKEKRLNEIGFCKVAGLSSVVELQSFMKSKQHCSLNEDKELSMVKKILYAVHGCKFPVIEVHQLDEDGESPSSPEDLFRYIMRIAKQTNDERIYEDREVIRNRFLKLQSVFNIKAAHVAVLLSIPSTSYRDFISLKSKLSRFIHYHC